MLLELNENVELFGVAQGETQHVGRVNNRPQ